MRLLIFHGYLLRGTGSNVYNAELAEALARLGHEVHLLSQEANPEQLGFVDSIGRWEGGRLTVHQVRRPPHAGTVTVYRPDIHGLLPVYVYDDYEGFEVRTFDRLDDCRAGALRERERAGGARRRRAGGHRSRALRTTC